MRKERPSLARPRVRNPAKSPLRNEAAPVDWFATNQGALYAALDALRARVGTWLQAHSENPEACACCDIPSGSWPPALERVAALFGLSPFEVNVLLLCAAHELDSRFGLLYADVQGDRARAFPTFGLALSLLSGSHWDALTPLGSLRRWRLVEMVGEGALTQNRLALDERVLHYLGGAAYCDQRIATIVRPVAAAASSKTVDRAAIDSLVQTWRQSSASGATTVVELVCDEADGARDLASAACDTLGLVLHEVDVSELPRSADERDQWCRLWAREALLLHSALYIDARHADVAEGTHALAAFLEVLRGIVVVGSRAPLLSLARSYRRMSLPASSANERVALWREALGSHAKRLNGALESIAFQFRLGTADIAAAGEEAVARSHDDAARFESALWSACRERARTNLSRLAQRVEPKARWEDLVLPTRQLDSLRLVAMHARYRARVHDGWGFAAKSARGMGICALFSGATGTGKTMAAEVLANELDLDLFRIDLAALVSKYVGETEKNLSRVFDAADAAGAILLFDEADALFGRRSEVRDSHDRYANIEVSYLLQRTEAYRGLAILTTNLASALDPAFARRLRFIVHFPFPDETQRREIWRRSLPRGAPRRALDYQRLARLDLAGGHIHNLALNAAFFAAADGEPIGMRHMRRAAECEFAKLERPLLDSEIGDWV